MNEERRPDAGQPSQDEEAQPVDDHGSADVPTAADRAEENEERAFETGEENPV